MIKKFFQVSLLISTIMLLVGCGTTDAKDIGTNKAKEIAFTDANVIETDISKLHISRENEDGKAVYEIKFVDMKSGIQYEYDILAADGTILKEDKDSEIFQTQETQQTELKSENSGQDDSKDQNKMQSNTQGNVSVSLEKAKKMVLDRVKGATENDLKIELDYDDGHYVYEGEIWYEQHEYEFEIDANTGNFLEWSQERR